MKLDHFLKKEVAERMMLLSCTEEKSRGCMQEGIEPTFSTKDKALEQLSLTNLQAIKVSNYF